MTWRNFNLSLLQAEVPTCFKKTAIIPVPKKTHAMCLKGYCLVSLTSTIVKWFDRLAMADVNSRLSACLDPLQFAYWQNRSTAAVISLALHSSLELLDNKDTHVRLLFINYGLTFNTRIPNLKTPRPLQLDPQLPDPQTTISEDVAVKKAQQRLFFLRQLRKFSKSIWILTSFYRYTTESILSGCITAWYSNCSSQGHKKLHKVVCTAQTMTEANLPSTEI
eukprot:g35905.t1